ncbi:MAG TPA: MnhB domain-containing protein [Acidimicrobiales bacterium]|nr:MnhB domain-containing protein [Acidimicrobiales bacterium]
MKVDRSVILGVSVGPLVHIALLFSVFLLFAGHNAPGGGFVGGLVAGAALILRFVDGGAKAVERTVAFAPQQVLGAGLLIALATGIAPWLSGGDFLESAKLSLDVPVIGTMKTTSALPFDIGVYLVVVGLMQFVLLTLGAEDEEDAG